MCQTAGKNNHNMKHYIDILKEVSSSLNINIQQSLFLSAVKEGIYDVELLNSDMIDLISKGYMRGNKVTMETFNTLDSILYKDEIKEEQKKAVVDYRGLPRLTTETGAVCKKLANHFLLPLMRSNFKELVPTQRMTLQSLLCTYS
jgi:hypothetical protein